MASDPQPKIALRASMLTDVGVVRDHNEDSAYLDPEERFFLVADGMGGHAAGEIASAMAVEQVRDALERADSQIREFAKAPTDTGRKALAGILEQAVRDAHAAVYDRGIKEPDKQGMGTTLDAVLLAGPEAFIAHVGDSRTFLLRGGKLAQITTDHTVAEVLLLEGKLSAEEAQVSPLRTILVNAIGVAEDVGVEMAHVRLQPGDQLLLSSDGLHDYFPSEEEIAENLAGKPEEILQRMVDVAKQRGGHDNVTGVVIQVLDVGDRVEAAAQAADDAVPEPMGRVDTLPFGEVALSPGELKGEAEDKGAAGAADSDEGEPDGREAASKAKSSGGAADVADRDGATGAGERGGAEAATGEQSDDSPAGDADLGARERREDADDAPAHSPGRMPAEKSPGKETASSSEADGAATGEDATPSDGEKAGAEAKDAEAGRSPDADASEVGTDDNDRPGANGQSPHGRAASPPVVAETKGPASAPNDDGDDDGDDEYVEDDTLVGYDPDAVKPPAPKSDKDDASDASETDRPDPELD